MVELVSETSMGPLNGNMRRRVAYCEQAQIDSFCRVRSVDPDQAAVLLYCPSSCVEDADFLQDPVLFRLRPLEVPDTAVELDCSVEDFLAAFLRFN